MRVYIRTGLQVTNTFPTEKLAVYVTGLWKTDQDVTFDITLHLHLFKILLDCAIDLING